MATSVNYLSTSLLGASKLTFEVSNVPDLLITNIPGSDDKQVSVPYEYTLINANVRPTVSCTYDSALVPDLQSMTLVKGGLPMAQLQAPGQSSRVPRAVENGTEMEGISRPRISLDVGNVEPPLLSEDLTDYYWCEVNDLRTGKIHQSGRVFIQAKGEFCCCCCC